MGVQDSINSMISTIGNMAVGMKHIQGQKVLAQGQAQANYDSALARADAADIQVAQTKDAIANAEIQSNQAVTEWNKSELERPMSDVEGDLANAKEKVNKAKQHITDYQAQFDPKNGGIGAPTNNQLKYIKQLKRKALSLERAKASYEVELESKKATKQKVNNLKGILNSKKDELVVNMRRADEAQKNLETAKQNKYLKGGKK